MANWHYLHGVVNDHIIRDVDVAMGVVLLFGEDRHCHEHGHDALWRVNRSLRPVFAEFP